ncbi:MAG: ribbon-helix-helix protein, CopG family [Betaproteobacteria bacterium]|nr:ribbon-helix-helix protein, CopG family [Betaproteobacteria bacterium]
MEKKTTTRVQLELPESSMERLRALREKTEATSYAEVIKNSLRLYEALIKEAESGNQVCIKDRKGKETSYRMIF